MLTAQRISFRYSPRGPWLLHECTVHLARGAWVGIQAPSGQGKTTLAQVLAGYRTPNRGTVTVDGAPLPRTGACPVQLIWQHPELAVNPRWRVGRTLTEGHQPDSSLLDALQISPAWHTRWPHELSGGELQRICIARALGPATRYLIADEMTTMLDAITQAQIWQAVRAHAQRHNLGVLVITHDAALLTHLCNDIIPLGQAIS